MNELSATTNSLNWFEIPMTDTSRAKTYYESIFKISLFEMDMMGIKMLMFPSQPPHIGGSLVKSESHIPSTTGSIIYLNANPDVQLVLDRIEQAGGKILMPKTDIGEEHGFMAFMMDSEGNTVGLHSNN